MMISCISNLRNTLPGGMGLHQILKLVVCALILLGMTTAQAQTIGLACNGRMQDGHTEGPIAAGAATIDLDRKQFVSPVGTFRIFSVNEQSIAFDDPANPLKVFGRIDRFTGDVTVMWLRPEEAAKLQAGATVKYEARATMRCVPSQRLF
jgi:hypothetical protein